MKKLVAALTLSSLVASICIEQASARPLNECVSVASGGGSGAGGTPREMLPDAQGRCLQGYVLYRTPRTSPLCFGLDTLGLHNMPPTLDGRCMKGMQLTNGWCRDPRIPFKCSPPREPMPAG